MATPCEGSASCENPEYDMSRTRPGLGASRSSTTQVALAPSELSVTSTSVPKARVGLAQPPGGASEYQVATPSSELSSAGAGGAVVVVVGGAVVVVVAVPWSWSWWRRRGRGRCRRGRSPGRGVIRRRYRPGTRQGRSRLPAVPALPLAGRARPARLGGTVRGGCRSVQQDKRCDDERRAEEEGEQGAPSPGGLCPQGSTLLHGHATRGGPTPPARGSQRR